MLFADLRETLAQAKEDLSTITRDGSRAVTALAAVVGVLTLVTLALTIAVIRLHEDTSRETI